MIEIRKKGKLMTHLESKNNLTFPTQAPLQLYTPTVPAILLYFRMIAGEGYMTFLLAFIPHAGFQQNIP